MKILVTGATGFLGHHLIQRLKRNGYEIRIFKEKSASMDLLKTEKVEIATGDIRNQKEVEKAVKGCNIVFHLAGLISYWKKLNALQYEINVEGTRNIVKACLENNVEKLIYVSSTVTIGVEDNEKLANENTSYNLSPLKIGYCDTKFLAEKEIYKGANKGLNAVILCPGSMYGEGDKRKIKTDLTFSFKFPMNFFYINGGLAVVDVKDVVEGLIKAWEKGRKGERYILAGENLSFYEIRKIIAKALDKNPPSICLPNWLLLLLSYIFVGISKITGKKPKLTPEIVKFNKIYFYFSNKKAKEELGITFKPFKESIKRAVNWYKKRGYIK